MATSEVQAGSVIRVKDWPGTVGERYVVKDIRLVPESPWPNQVHAWRIDKSGTTISLATERAFPLEHCVIDPRKTKEYERHVARVRARLGKEEE